MGKKVFTTYQVGKICNVHHTSIINWIDEGKLKSYRTPGGHRRVIQEDLLEFMHKHKIPIPTVLKRERKSILIVDDDREALEELQLALSCKVFDIELAYDGFQAARKIYKKKPDLILLDFRMPGMNGFEVCEMLHRDKETFHIPIIAITALISKKDYEKIINCGVVEYMSKPIDIDKLLKLIKKHLI